MVTFENFERLALSLPGTIIAAHFEKISFRVGKKIYATYDHAKHVAVLKLTEINQASISAQEPVAIYPVANKWGKQGWTIFDLAIVKEDLFKKALTLAHGNIKKSAGFTTDRL